MKEFARTNLAAQGQEALKPLFAVGNSVKKSSIEKTLQELIKLRVSQINGCAFCLDMHWKDLRAIGETEQRLYSLDAWRECPYYSDRERAALAWTEALTLISQTNAPDEVYNELRNHFTDLEIVNLSYAITTINAWNRLAIGFRAQAGTYQPPKPAAH